MSFGRRVFYGTACIALLGAAGLRAAPARAETLADAIALAYQTNPTLQAQRAQQRALDETYVQARAGWRPTVGVNASATYQRTDFGRSSGPQVVNNGTGEIVAAGAGHVETNYGQAALSATQPLYTGGRTAWAVNSAEAGVLAGREGLRAVESQVLQNVITAYADVLRDQEIVGIRRDNVDVLVAQREETKAKFDVGQVTRTDVAQAEAQLAAARALLTSAQAQLQVSRANYAAVVGQNPGQLAPEPPLPGLPATVDQAFDIAEAENPTLSQAELTEQVSRAKVSEARAGNRPTVSLQGSVGYVGSIAPFDPRAYERNLTGEVVYTQPLFAGGVVRSQVRQAIEQNTSDRLSIEAARRSVVQQVSQAWNLMVSDHANVASDVEQVAAARVAFEGIREQYRVGLSTTLDVLIQQQTLRDAELSLVQARHDEYVAGASLLGAMGRLELAALVQGEAPYDPAKSFNRVRRYGSVPWEGAVEALDSVGAPRLSAPGAAPSPPQPGGPVTMVPATTPVPSGAPLSTVSPTAPRPAQPHS